MTRYLNAFLHARCTASGYDAPLWTSVQITNQGAGAHKDTSNRPGTFNYAISVGDFAHGELWIEDPSGPVSVQVQGTRMRGNVYSTRDAVLRFQIQHFWVHLDGHGKADPAGSRFSIAVRISVLC